MNFVSINVFVVIVYCFFFFMKLVLRPMFIGAYLGGKSRTTFMVIFFLFIYFFERVDMPIRCINRYIYYRESENGLVG